MNIWQVKFTSPKTQHAITHTDRILYSSENNILPSFSTSGAVTIQMKVQILQLMLDFYLCSLQTGAVYLFTVFVLP